MHESATRAAISVENLTKRYEKVLAIQSLTFDVAAGTTTALLGGNGAGKTTTIAILLGVLLPTEGRVTILGEDMLRHRHRVLPRMNFSSPYVDLPRRLTVAENLRVYAHLYGLRDVNRRLRELGEALDIASLMKRPLGNLSNPICCCWMSRPRRSTPTPASGYAITFATIRKRRGRPSCSPPTT